MARKTPDDALAYDTDDLTRILRVGSRTIWRWSRSGIMPAPCKVSGRYLFSPKAVQSALANKAAQSRKGRDAQ